MTNLYDNNKIINGLETKISSESLGEFELAETALSSAQEYLQAFAKHPDFIERMKIAFSESPDNTSFQKAWSTKDFSNLPSIQIRRAKEINFADGGYVGTINNIYLSSEFLSQNANNPEKIVSVLLEEIGHSVDWQLNHIDSPGDEGEIFSALVTNKQLSKKELQSLKTQNDTAIITLDGQEIQIEQSTEDIREVLKQSINWALDRVESALLNIQDAELPLIGEKVQELANRTQKKINEFRNDIDRRLDKLEDRGEKAVENFIFKELGNEGLGLLKDLNKDGKLDKNDVRVSLDPDNCNFQFNLGNPAPLELLNFDLESDFGLPNLGFTIDEGQAQVDLGYEVKLNFGVDRVNDSSSLYFNTSNEDEIKLKFDVSLPDLEARGKLGFLQLDIEDNGTNFQQELIFDLQDNDNLLRLGETPSVDTNLDGAVDLNLDLKTNFDGSEKLPSILSNFVLQWDFANAQLSPGSSLSNFGNIPNIAFNDVQIDLGTFFRDFADPILKNAQEVTKPIEPIAKFLERIIKFSDSNRFAKFALETLFDLDANELAYFKQILDLVDLVNTIPTDSNLAIDLGSFNLTGNDPRKENFQLKFANPNITRAAESLQQQTANTEAGKYLNRVANTTKDSLKFPIIEKPRTAFDLLLGKNVDLFTYKLPDLNININREYPLAVFPFGGFFFAIASLKGKFKATSNVELGFDTFGLIQFQENNNADIDNIFNGFFIKDNGNQPLIFVELGIGASAIVKVGLPSVLSFGGGISGGITGNIGLDLIDPDNDGKVRKNELIDTFYSSPLDLFNINGGVDFVVDGFIEAEFPLGTVILYDQNLITEELLNFTVDFRDGTKKDNQKPFLATNLGFTDFSQDGILRLNIGSDAVFRQGNNNDPNEVYIIKHGGFTATNETILISSFGVVQNYKSIKKIIGDAGQGNDVIILADRDVLVVAELSGGEGDDKLVGGNNNDTLKGDIGNDCLMGSAGADTLGGGEGNDTASYETSPAMVNVSLLTKIGVNADAEKDRLSFIENLIGSSFADSLFGDEIDNILLGRGNNDYLEGNEGNDLLNGENGSDLLLGEDGNDTLIGDAIDNSLCVGDEKDSLSGWSGDDNNPLPGDDLLSGGLGNDSLIGNEGNDTLNGNKGSDTLRGNEGDDLLSGQQGKDSLSGNEGNDTLSGNDGVDTLIGNAGNDLLSGNKENDLLYGNEGNDTLNGNEGFDSLNGGFDNDLLAGGIGNDFLSGDELNDTLFGNQGNDSLEGRLGDDNLDGGEQNDILMGGYGRDTLIGGNGKDTLIGFDARDSLLGGNENDFLDGQNGNDILRGEEGNDTLIGSTENDSLVGGLGNDSLNAGENNDIAKGSEQNDTLQGGSGHDTLYGGTNEDLISGETGDDLLFGDEGNDTLIGNEGRDALTGDNGNDILTGNQDKDTLTGGTGSDRFIYTQIQDAGDLITDFEVGSDRIVLTQLFKSLQLNIPNYDTAISQGYLGFSSQSDRTVLLVDRDGTGIKSSEVLIAFDALTPTSLDNSNNFVI